jgi:hypothetical protein
MPSSSQITARALRGHPPKLEMTNGRRAGYPPWVSVGGKKPMKSTSYVVGQMSCIHFQTVYNGFHRAVASLDTANRPVATGLG